MNSIKSIPFSKKTEKICKYAEYSPGSLFWTAFFVGGEFFSAFRQKHKGKKVKKSRKPSKIIMSTTEKIAPIFCPKRALWKNLWKMWKTQFPQGKNQNLRFFHPGKFPNFRRKIRGFQLLKLRVTETKSGSLFPLLFAEKVCIFQNYALLRMKKGKHLPQFLA